MKEETKKKHMEGFNKILSEMSKGKSLGSMLKGSNAVMSASTFFDMMKDDKALTEQYARALELRQNMLFEELFDIADESDNDWEEDERTGKKRVNNEAVQRSKLKVDVRKWALSKMNPKKYGDRQIVAGDKENPLHIENNVDEKFSSMITNLQLKLQSK
jgi:hypothetical protein